MQGSHTGQDFHIWRFNARRNVLTLVKTQALVTEGQLPAVWRSRQTAAAYVKRHASHFPYGVRIARCIPEYCEMQRTPHRH